MSAIKLRVIFLGLKLANQEKTNLVVNVEYAILYLLVDFFSRVNESLQMNEMLESMSSIPQWLKDFTHVLPNT